MGLKEELGRVCETSSADGAGAIHPVHMELRAASGSGRAERGGAGASEAGVVAGGGGWSGGVAGGSGGVAEGSGGPACGGAVVEVMWRMRTDYSIGRLGAMEGKQSD